MAGRRKKQHSNVRNWRVAAALLESAHLVRSQDEPRAEWVGAFLGERALAPVQQRQQAAAQQRQERSRLFLISGRTTRSPPRVIHIHRGPQRQSHPSITTPTTTPR